MSNTEINSSATLIYDGDCPVCRNYVRFLRVKATVGELRLVDARAEPQWVGQLADKGLDLNVGMVLKLGEQYFHGADAMQSLAMMSTQSGFFNRLNYWLFRSPARARLAYPVLRAGRNTLLRILRKKPIDVEQHPDNG